MDRNEFLNLKKSENLNRKKENEKQKEYYKNKKDYIDFLKYKNSYFNSEEGSLDSFHRTYSAAELYKILHVSGAESNYVFRGQECSTYDLEPGIARKDKKLENYAIFDELISDDIDFLKYEYDLLRYFIKGCDKTGIAIQNDGHELRKSFSLIDDRISIPFGMQFDKDLVGDFNVPRSWPDINSFSLMIMAQHHGVPTRLLDWTKSYLTAMYFASVGGMKKMMSSAFNKEDKISVWRLNGKALNEKMSSRVALINPPPSLSVNIAPQEGCFTTLMNAPFKRSSYVLNKIKGANFFLERYDLNIYQSVDMYEICALNGYTGAKLFPGLDGAAREAGEMYMLKTLRGEASRQNNLRPYHHK